MEHCLSIIWFYILVQILIMIFKTPPKAPPTKPQCHKSWKSKFIISLYNRNLRTLTSSHSVPHDFNKAAMTLISTVRQFPDETKIFQEQSQSEHLTHMYCSFIPLKKNIQFDDEIVNTFLHVRRLKDSNNLREQDNFYSEIRKFLQACKQDGRVEVGWEICLKRCTVELDVLKRIEIYMQVLLKGTKFFSEFHRLYAKMSLIDIFFERVMSVGWYFQKESRLNNTWKISLEMKDKINEANISKTMKMLYCSICLLYDCGKHKLEDSSHHRDHHYCHPKNHMAKIVHIQKAIKLLKEFKSLERKTIENKKGCCSENCYRKFTKISYLEVEISKTKAVSPMVQSIIKMGISMFSYDPCKIKDLFPKHGVATARITCCLVFFYLIEDHYLESRLDFKINGNEIDYLMNETTSGSGQIQNKMLSLKRKKAKGFKEQEYKYQQVALCFHHFIDHEPIDRGCQNCLCFRRGFCLPECQCGPNCPIIITGCSCKSKKDCQTLECSCYKLKIECIPGICNNCFPGACSQKKNLCRNDQILRGCSQKMRIGFSKIPQAGLGAFAQENIKRGSLVSVYCGEVLDQEMETIRETLKKGESFYNFACFEGSIDARFMGNKTRFINHANEGEGMTNLISLNMFSQGQQHIGLYALRDIKEGEELLFDYDIEGEMAQKYSHAHNFLKKAGSESNKP